MKINYDQKQDALYIRFTDQSYQESEEVEEGIILDYGTDGEIVGLEILNVSQRFSQDFLDSILNKEATLELTLPTK